MPQLDPVKALFLSQLFWLAVTFGLLYLFIAFYVTPRIESVLARRKSLVRSDLDTADELRAQTQHVIDSYEAKITASKKQSALDIEQARASFGTAADAQKSAHGQKLATQLAAAEQALNAQREAALASIQDMAAELTDDLVQKVSGIKETSKTITAAIKAV